MAEQQQEPERPGVRRRSSLGRALERMRDALKRRRSSTAATATLQSTREEEGAARTEEARPAPGEAAKHEDVPVAEPKVPEPRESNADSELVPDDNADDVDFNEEPLTPAYTSRMGITEDKAKALFERYGIKYQPRGPQTSSDPFVADKIRRVERPVRIRIHWTCHECQKQFGHERACLSCGHRRCGECIRSPPKKVKAILDEAKQMRMEEERKTLDKSQILTAIAPNTVASPGQPRAVADDQLDVDAEDADAADISQYSMAQRPRSGIKLVMRSKAPTMRRVCHECQAPFASKNQMECGSCGHQRCNACPMLSIKPANEDEAPFEPTMVATVQRVYRKPRQRVRWRCDKCQAIFVEGHTCRNCSHQRCETCVRSPIKRDTREPDPSVVQSLNDKIQAWQLGRESTAAPLQPDIGSLQAVGP